MRLPAIFSNRRFALYAGCSLVVCLTLLLTCHRREIKALSVEEEVPEAGRNISKEANAAEMALKRSSGFAGDSYAATTPSLTSDEKGVINELSLRLTASLQAIEKANAETAFEFEGGNETTVAVRVTALNEIQTQEAYLAAFKLINELPQRLHAAWRVASQAILVDYTTFRKPYKILILSASPKGKDVLFVERFVSDPNEGLPDKSGIINLKGSDGYRLDTTWGNEDSWAFRRYSHLVDIKNGDVSGNHPLTTSHPEP